MSVRRSRMLFLARGKYSSMMDLGGVPAGEVKSRLDYGKNSKVRVVALDFDLMTRSIDASRATSDTKDGNRSRSGNDGASASAVAAASPNVDVLRDVASMLGVTLGGENGDDVSLSEVRRGGRRDDERRDDLSALLAPEEEEAAARGRSSSSSSSSSQDPATYVAPDRTRGSIKAPPVEDVRDKYAKRLRDKLDSSSSSFAGGLGSTADATTPRAAGDAADLVLAKKLVASTESGSGGVGKSGSKWLSSTECGTLLSFLQSRSMKIALLPIPIATTTGREIASSTNQRGEGGRMDDLTRQLPKIEFHHLIKQPEANDNDDEEPRRQNAQELLKRVLRVANENADEHEVVIKSETNFAPKNFLVVSDRDDYIKWARECGMYTCRVRRPNSRRGNVTANYNVEDIKTVEDVVNEINGISFNTVFSLG